MRRGTFKRDPAFFNEPFRVGKRNPCYARTKTARVNSQDQVPSVPVVIIFTIKPGTEPENLLILPEGVHDTDIPGKFS
jgi:hypothetical protein